MGYEKLRRIDMAMEMTARRQYADGLIKIGRQCDDDMSTARRR